MSLISSLGLDAVAADPNDVPDGKYDGEVMKSEFVLVESKDTVSHAITYKVTEGDFAGAQKQQWYTLYKNVRNGEGNFPSEVTDIKAAEPALSESQKRWYKKLLVDLTGCSEEDASKVEPENLIGTKVTFGIKTKDGYKNINFVERRDADGAQVTGPVDPFSGGPGF